MLQVCMKRDFEKEKEISLRFSQKKPDIVVNRVSFQSVEKDGGIFTKVVLTPINLTRKINETSKLVKQDTAFSKLQELEEVLKNSKF